MPESNQRKYPRLKMQCRVKIIHDSIGEIIVITRDISDGGIFLVVEPETLPPIGSRVKGQVQDMPVEAPLVEMEVVRSEPGGVGLRFIGDKKTL